MVTAERRSSLQRQGDAGGCANPFNERPTVNLGMALGLPAVTDTWRSWVRRKISSPGSAMLLGALNLTPIEVAQAFQTIASGGTVPRFRPCVR
ncbi:hypothetical protein ACNKHO_01085 [Shigella flexneri]